MRSRGFTLIELLTVIVIISILAGMIIAGAFVAVENAKKREAEGDIASLENALSMYETDVGSYPSTSGVVVHNSFKDWLMDNTASVAGWNGPYMHFDSKDLDGSSFKDPWGNKYKYRCPGIDHHPPDHSDYFDIWSYGPDGVNNSGGGDDITNW